MNGQGKVARKLIVAICAIVLAGATASQATVVVRLDPADVTVEQGDTFTMNLVADLGDDAVIGWGLDVAFDGLLISQVGNPAIGPWWIGGYAPDGDRLTGSVDAFSDPDGDGVYGSVSGNNVLLARLTFSANELGTTNLVPSHTPTDLNEGFPLDPSGFASVSYRSAEITIVPEPGVWLLGLFCLTGILSRRR